MGGCILPLELRAIKVGPGGCFIHCFVSQAQLLFQKAPNQLSGNSEPNLSKKSILKVGSSNQGRVLLNIATDEIPGSGVELLEPLPPDNWLRNITFNDSDSVKYSPELAGLDLQSLE